METGKFEREVHEAVKWWSQWVVEKHRWMFTVRLGMLLAAKVIMMEELGMQIVLHLGTDENGAIGILQKAAKEYPGKFPAMSKMKIMDGEVTLASL